VSPWKVILATMVIFVCGVVTGALVIKTQGWHEPPPSRGAAPRLGVPGPIPIWEIISRLNSELDLTPEQLQKIEKIMQDSQATNTAIRKTIAPLLKAEVERAHQAIKERLNPEQQIKYAAFLLKEQQRTEGQRGRGGERGGRARNPNRASTNGAPEGTRGRMDAAVPTNSPSTNAP